MHGHAWPYSGPSSAPPTPFAAKQLLSKLTFKPSHITSLCPHTNTY
jgi:hypothetical protein